MGTCTADLDISNAGDEANTSEARRWAGPLLVVLAAIVPYIATLRFGFVYDDDGQILGAVPIRSWAAVPGYFSKPVPGIFVRYYRPLFFFWLRLNHSLWKTHPLGWHFSSLLLHVAVCLLVLAILRRYFADPRYALIGACIFAVHPAHVETVAWVSGSTDALMALAMLGALLLWMRYRETASTRLRVGSLLCYGVALLSKETAVILPILIWLHSFSNVPAPIGHHKQSDSRRAISGVWEAIPYAGLAVVYLVVRHAVLRGVPGAPEWISRTQMILTIPSLLLFYLRHLIWPAASSLFYDFSIVSRFSSASFWAPLMALVVAAVGICVWFWRSRDSRVLLASFWFLVPILPVLYIRLFEPDDFVHDRYLYLSVLGLAIAAALLIDMLWSAGPSERTWRLSLVLVSVLVLSLALATSTQAQPWKSNLLLYKNAVLVAPRNSIAGNNLASEYCAESRYEDAADVLHSLLKIHPDMWLANYNYGYVNYRIGNFILADLYLHRAIRMNPTDPDEYFFLGTTYLEEGRLQDAVNELHEAIARAPYHAGYHLALGVTLMKRDDLSAAQRELSAELQYHPNNGAAHVAEQQLQQKLAAAAQ